MLKKVKIIVTGWVTPEGGYMGSSKLIAKENWDGIGADVMFYLVAAVIRQGQMIGIEGEELTKIIENAQGQVFQTTVIQPL